MVKTLAFGDIEVPSPGFGAMGISFGLGSNLSLEEAEPVLLKAIELGCTFWDTAVSVTQVFAFAIASSNYFNSGGLPSRCKREAPWRVH